jgi:SAM-dependent methyltransferase
MSGPGYPMAEPRETRHPGHSEGWEAGWRHQRGLLGAQRRSPFGEWYEWNWASVNQYWAEFINRHAPGRRLLECGAATGRLPLQLTKEGWQCALVDITTEGPLLARERFQAAGRGALFVCGDVYQLPFEDESFDVVYSSGLLDALPDINSATREMVTVLRPGGLFAAASNPRRRSVQTVATGSVEQARRLWRLLRRRPNQGDSLTPPRPSPFRNDFSLEAHVTACREAGLENVHGHGIWLLPVLQLPSWLMLAYVHFSRGMSPLATRFNWSEAAWTAKWGVMLAVYGFKQASAPLHFR